MKNRPVAEELFDVYRQTGGRTERHQDANCIGKHEVKFVRSCYTQSPQFEKPVFHSVSTKENLQMTYDWVTF
jgi:hypothetical protein